MKDDNCNTQVKITYFHPKEVKEVNEKEEAFIIAFILEVRGLGWKVRVVRQHKKVKPEKSCYACDVLKI